MEWIKNTDLFRKPKEELEKSTHCGAIITIVAAVAIWILCSSEDEYQSQLKEFHEVKIGRENELFFTVEINMTFLATPCSLLGFDHKDLSGPALDAVGSSLHYERWNANMTELIPSSFIDSNKLSYHFPRFDNESKEFQIVLTGAVNEEACRVYGNFQARRIPGSFRFGHFNQSKSLLQLKKWAPKLFENINLSHNISTIIFSPLETRGSSSGNIAAGSAGLDEYPFNATYYMRAIPIHSHSGDHQIHYSFNQAYTYESEVCIAVSASEFDYINFKYDSTPFYIKYYAKETYSTFMMIVNICGICCGVYWIGAFFQMIFIYYFKHSVLTDQYSFTLRVGAYVFQQNLILTYSFFMSYNQFQVIKYKSFLFVLYIILLLNCYILELNLF